MGGSSRGRSRRGSWPPRGHRGTRRGTSRLGVRHFKLTELAQLLEESLGPLGLFGIDLAQGEADVDEHVVAEPGIRQVLEAHLPYGAAKVGAPHPEPAVLEDLYHLAGDGEAHYEFPGAAARRRPPPACPSDGPPSFVGT